MKSESTIRRQLRLIEKKLSNETTQGNAVIAGIAIKRTLEWILKSKANSPDSVFDLLKLHEPELQEKKGQEDDDQEEVNQGDST